MDIEFKVGDKIHILSRKIEENKIKCEYCGETGQVSVSFRKLGELTIINTKCPNCCGTKYIDMSSLSYEILEKTISVIRIGDKWVEYEISEFGFISPTLILESKYFDNGQKEN